MPRDVTLTLRQQQILWCAALGMTNRQTARRLWLSEDTVKTHLKRAFAAYGVRDRTQMVVRAMLAGVLDPTRPMPQQDDGATVAV